MLELSALSTSYEGFSFGPVDLTVENEVLAVLGPSGSGKTTLLSLIAGIVSQDAGDISLNGRALTNRPVDERATGIVFQDGALFPHMTARENINYAATDEDRCGELAELLEIADVLDRRPPTLSGGERQRVALARTLAAEPEALLLDEPLSSLDAPIRRRLRSELHDLFASLDIPIIYVTHDQRTASALGDRLAIFRDGTVEQVGPVPHVLRRPETRFVAEFTGNENIFEATVSDNPRWPTTVRLGDVVLQVDGASVPDTSVTICMHPSRIQLRPPGEVADTDTVNVISGTVAHWLNEGNEYRVDASIDGSPITVTARVQPPIFERLGVDTGSTIRIEVPPDAIHLLGS